MALLSCSVILPWRGHRELRLQFCDSHKGAPCVHRAKFRYMCFHGHCFFPASKLKGTGLWYGGLRWGARN